jgi:hypothetical protein
MRFDEITSEFSWEMLPRIDRESSFDKTRKGNGPARKARKH